MTINKILAVFAVLMMTSAFLSGQVNVERYRIEADKDNTAGDILLSAILIKGNTDVINADASAGVFYKKGLYQFFLKGTLNFGEKNGEKYINKGFIHVRGVRKISQVFSGEVFTQGEFNEFILLKSRTLAGAGARIRILKNDRLLIYAGTGLMIEKEIFSEKDGRILKEDTEYLKTTNYISLNWKINKTSSMGLVTYWQAPFSRFSGYRFLTDLSLRFKLSGIFTFFSTLNHRYDNWPPETIKKYDFTLKSGIGIQF